MQRSSLRYVIRRGVVPAVALALIASGLASAGVMSRRTPEARLAPVVQEAPDTETAIRTAAAQRSSVRITGLTTETRVIDAQPDSTLTATVTAVPVRVRQGQRRGP